MLQRHTIIRVGAGLVGAAALSLGGAGFLTASNAASTSPACQGGANASVGTQAGSSGATTNGSASAGTSAGNSGAASLPSTISGIGTIPSGATGGLPTLPTTSNPGQDPISQLLATIDQALAGTPVAGLVPAAVSNPGSGLFVGASNSSSRTGATVTPDSSGNASHVGVVGVPGTSGSLTNLGL